MSLVNNLYLLPLQIDEAANNWNSASTGIGKQTIIQEIKFLVPHYIGLKRPASGPPLS